MSNAIKAIDGVKNKPEYANLRIAHGKDRCANPPRSGPQGASGTRRASGNGPNSAEPISAIGDGEDGEMLAGEVAFLNGELDDDEGLLDLGENGHVGNGEAPEMRVDGVEAAVMA